jgi:hypothetical protein
MSLQEIRMTPLRTRIDRADWTRALEDVDASGWARLPALLTPVECRDLVASYDDERRFRSTIDMERYRFGRGQYRYFSYPLPTTVQSLRERCYPRLQPLAQAWTQRLRGERAYPDTLAEFLAACRSAGQSRPTPLLLRYAPGDYNCLHQDVYGDVAFPLQMSLMLSQRGRDYDGGEIVLVEQRPRAQSRAFALELERGDALIFTNRMRPVHGARGWYAAQMRHGISPLLRGSRFVLGVIFHDAR